MVRNQIWVSAGALFLAASFLSPSPWRRADPETGGAPPADDVRLVARAVALAERFAARDGVPGLSMALASGAETLVERGFGFADLEHMAAAEADTVYRIGSLTQAFTAVAILLLVEDEKLALDDPLSKLFPDWPAAVRSVTVRQLLTHTSGIPSYTALGLRFGDDFCAGMTREDILALFIDRPLDFEPGTQFAVSSSGYFVLGLVLEQVSGEQYTEFMTRHVFEPLGMEHTVYCYEERLMVRRASGYQDIGGELYNDAPLDIDHPFSAGALCSTVGDLVRFQRGLVDGRLLSESTWELMTQPTRLPGDAEAGFGLGFGVDETDGHRSIGCSGAINGFRSHLSYYPELDLTIVLLANAEDAPLHELEHEIARVALGLAPEEIVDLPLDAAAQRVYLGNYQVGSSRYIVRAHGPRLVLLPPIEDEFELLCQGEHAFVSAVDPTTRVFFQTLDGRAESFRLVQGGTEQIARRID